MLGIGFGRGAGGGDKFTRHAIHGNAIQWMSSNQVKEGNTTVRSAKYHYSKRMPLPVSLAYILIPQVSPPYEYDDETR